MEAVIKHVDQPRAGSNSRLVLSVRRDVAACQDDGSYRRYRTFLCACAHTSEPVAGARDGTATIRQLRWLRLDDERYWGIEITNDRFLHPQLRPIRSAITQHGSAG
jgi:hypothetical protein